MKIAIFTDSYHPQVNGVVVFLHESLKLLSKKDRIILFAPGGKELEIEKKGNITTYWLAADPFPFYKGYRMTRPAPFMIRKILKHEKPDVVHVHAPVLLGVKGMIIAKRLGLPTIATYHTHFPDYLPHILKGSLLKRLNWIGSYTAKKLIKLVFSSADVATAPTKELVKELRGYGITNVVYLPNGVNIKRLKTSKASGDRFAKRYGIDRTKKIVLYTGRVSHEKKLDVLIRAFKRIDDGKVMLLIVGSGPSLGECKKLAKNLHLGNVMFTGYVNDDMLFSAYRIADVFVSPSDSETFGMTFIEAMAFGLPVIGIRKLGAKELITHGKDGYLVGPGSTDELARHIKKLLKDRRLTKRMGKNAKKTAEKFSIEECIKRTKGLYYKVAKDVQKRKV